VVAVAIAIRPALQESLPRKKITIGSFPWCTVTAGVVSTNLMTTPATFAPSLNTPLNEPVQINVAGLVCRKTQGG
jgi:hypothetical protein